MGSATVRVGSLVWFATGVVLAVLATVMVTEAWRADAAPGDTDTTFVPVTPCRLVDTRQPGQVTFGPNEIRTLDAHGSNGDCIIPVDAVGLSMNVTAVGATVPGTYLTIWEDLVAIPTASSLNPAPGQPPTPNAVTVPLSPAGRFNVFNFVGSVDVIIDINGYYTKASLAELAARLTATEAEKANVSDVYMKSEVYTRTEADARYIPHGEIVLGYGQQFNPNTNVPPTLVRYLTNTTKFEGGNGIVHLQLEGPHMMGGVEYGLKSLSYCIYKRTAPAKVFTVRVQHFGPGLGQTSTTDWTDRSVPGCYTLEVNNKTATSHEMNVQFSGGGGSISLRNVTATWAPITTLAKAPTSPVVDDPGAG